MRLRKVISALIKYQPFVGLLIILAISLYLGATTITDEMERNIRIWTDALIISAAIGGMCSLLVMERCSLLVTGKIPNIVDDIVEQSSKELSVSYNGLIAGAFLCAVLFILGAIYLTTKIRLFLFCCTFFAIIFVLSTVCNAFALYLQAKKSIQNHAISKLLDPVFLPMIICLIQFLVTRQKTVGFVYQNLYKPQSTVLLILSLLLVLCYVLAMAFCYYSNIYCLIAFAFEKKDSQRIQAKINAVQEKCGKRENALRQIAEYVDEKAEQVGFFKRLGLSVEFFYAHIKAHFQERYYAVSYLLLFGSLRLAKRLGGLLETERIRISGMRFCEVTAVLELLLLDMLLFIYLGAKILVRDFLRCYPQ
ncbi:MAG: hypothetical protein ABT01_08575 [Clostridium sp. SCN 57-10]|nr:MAG: hypothetical protein ABT01_08575 [Clostridium sp. SCN 57-10]